MAYVLRLSFDGKIPNLDKYADLDCAPHYYIVPGDNTGSLVLGSDLTLTGKRKDYASQWTLKSVGKGFYEILNRENGKRAIECSTSAHDLDDFRFHRK